MFSVCLLTVSTINALIQTCKLLQVSIYAVQKGNHVTACKKEFTSAQMDGAHTSMHYKSVFGPQCVARVKTVLP